MERAISISTPAISYLHIAWGIILKVVSEKYVGTDSSWNDKSFCLNMRTANVRKFTYDYNANVSLVFCN